MEDKTLVRLDLEMNKLYIDLIRLQRKSEDYGKTCEALMIKYQCAMNKLQKNSNYVFKYADLQKIRDIIVDYSRGIQQPSTGARK